MRALILAPVVVVMLAGPAASQQADPEFDAIAARPCSSVAKAFGTSRYADLISPIVNHIQDKALAADRLGSTCNIGDYFKAECKASPGKDIGFVTKQLMMKAAGGKRLPSIPICGA